MTQLSHVEELCLSEKTQTISFQMSQQTLGVVFLFFVGQEDHFVVDVARLGQNP